MLVSGVVAGLIVGLASGGHWRRLQTLDIKWWPILVLGVAARAIAPFLGVLALSLSIVGLALVAAVAVANRIIPGAMLIAVGALLNLLVIVANGGMPVDPAAIAAAGKTPPDDGFHTMLTEQTRLGFLADVLLVPIVNNIYSVGDVALAIGGFWMSFRLVRPR